MNFKTWMGPAMLALTLIGTSASAAECVPQAEMQIIAQHFTQFRNLANADYCYDGSPTSGLIQALEFMRTTKYAPGMPKSTDELFSGAFADDWWEYFIGRIDEFDVQSSCPKGVGAYVYMFGNTMYVCPMLLTDNFTALDRTSVMMHEARHIDGFPHVTCQRGPRSGIDGACDERISDQGSYAVSVETYAQLGAYATDLHPALRAYAAAAAVNYADEAFDIPGQIERAGGFLLMTTGKEFYRLAADGSAALTRLGDTPALGHMVQRSHLLILFPDDKSLPAQFVFAHNEGEIQQAAGDIALEYNGQTPQERANLVDVHLAGRWNTRVYRNHILFACDPHSERTEDLPLTNQVAAGILYLSGYDRSSSSAHLITEDGSILEMGCQSGRAFVKPALISMDQKYKRVQKSGNEVLGLTAEGRLFRLSGNSSTPLVTSVEGRIHDLVPTESYQFFASK